MLRVDEIVTAVGESPRLVLNLSHLRLLPSEFIAMLIAVHRRIRAGKGILRSCGLCDDTHEVLRIMKLDSFFEICVDEKGALGDSSQLL